MIHVKHEEVFNIRIIPHEYVLVECEEIPFNLVEISDHIISKNAFPLFSIKHDCYSFIKIKKSDLSSPDAGLCIVSGHNNNFINTFVFESEKIDMSKPIYITETKNIADFTKHLDKNGVEYREMNYIDLGQYIKSMNPDKFEFKTDVVKSRTTEDVSGRVLSICMRSIRDNQYGIEYKNRLEEEMMKYSRYGLVNLIYDVYCFSKAWDHLLLRGSANNSLVLYLLGISVIDPIRDDRPFERFINGNKMFEVNYDSI